MNTEQERISVLIEILDSGSSLLERVSNAPASGSFIDVPGFVIDQNYKPIRIPARKPQTSHESGSAELFSAVDATEAYTYLIKGEVEDEKALNSLIKAVEQHPNGAKVYSNQKIFPSPFYFIPDAVGSNWSCPNYEEPVGTVKQVADLLNTVELQKKGMDGCQVMVAIVDCGINLDYLRKQGLNPGFDLENSWTPVSSNKPGQASTEGILGHGTMIAFDACIAAPNCTLLDYQLLATGSADLSSAIKAYSKLLNLLKSTSSPQPALVVNNSWAVYDPTKLKNSNYGDYIDDPDHPFTRLVRDLALAGGDILFSAGDCGEECPVPLCQGDLTQGTIYGANSSPSVLAIAAVTTEKVRLGYSSKGPGRLCETKPDLSVYSHFEGSGIVITGKAVINGKEYDFETTVDSGTSAASATAAGVVAAIRSVYPPSKLSSAALRELLRSTAEAAPEQEGFDYSYGYGIINVSGFLNQLEQEAEEV